MQTFLIILPLIVIALTGYLSVKTKLLDKTHIDALTKVCFTLLLPIFLFNTTYHADLSSNMSVSWFLAFYIPIIVLFFIIFFIDKKLNLNPKNSGHNALSSTYSNTVLVAIPILSFYLPTEVAGLAFVLIAFHSALLFTATEVLTLGTGLHSIFKTTKNPIVQSILFGFACNYLSVPIPTLILDPLVQLSRSAIPLALFGLGASIFFIPIRGNLKKGVLLSLVKLLVLPLFVFITAEYVMSLPPIQVFIAVILTASPTGVGAYIMAKNNDIGEELAAKIVVISTILCPITYLFWLNVLPIP